MLRQTYIAFVLCVATLSGCSSSDDFECPAPQLQSSDGVLKETPDDIQAYRVRFANDFSENAISDAIASLRIKYPDAQNDAIANYLVAAYCPNVRGQAVGSSSQKAKLAAFENAVHAVLGD